MDIQDLCKQRRYEMRISNQEIADEAGISVNTVANFFATRSKAPTMNTVGPICSALGVSLDEFFGICVENREAAELREEVERLKAQLSARDDMEAAVRNAVSAALSPTIPARSTGKGRKRVIRLLRNWHPLLREV